jgi:hypothetical protein
VFPHSLLLDISKSKIHSCDFQLVNDYLRDNYWERLGMPERDSRQLNISVCRLVLDIMPGLEASAVFQVHVSEDLSCLTECVLYANIVYHC